MHTLLILHTLKWPLPHCPHQLLWSLTPPDIATPVWPPPQPRLPTHVPNFQSTPTQFSSPQPRSQVHFATLSPGVTVQLRPDPMQLCTSSEATSPSLVSQRGLPGYLPTPGREIYQLTSHVQGNWDYLFGCLKRQDKAVKELTQEVFVEQDNITQT